MKNNIKSRNFVHVSYVNEIVNKTFDKIKFRTKLSWKMSLKLYFHCLAFRDIEYMHKIMPMGSMQHVNCDDLWAP